MARSLYFQNLDTNLGALLRIEEEGEVQEICEALLAYFVLLSRGYPLEKEEVDRVAEDILQEIAGFRIDFDVEDALRDLTAAGLISFSEKGWYCVKGEMRA